MTPTIGQIVHYVSKVGDGVESPALVLRTRRSTVPEVIDRWEGGEEIPVLDDEDRETGLVHVAGERPDGVVAELPDDETVDLKVSGLGKTYREYAVPHHPPRARLDSQPGTWHWHTECGL